jgi:photosystem II stability/assembly factor-like uncharacterized protein
MKKTFTFLTLLVCSCIIQAQSFWSNLNSPTGHRYYAVSHDGSKFFSSNGFGGASFAQLTLKQGAGTWNPVTMSGFTTTTTFNNIYCAANGNLIVTGSQGSSGVVFKSTNDGTTWAQSSYTLTGFNQNILEDASGNIYIYKIGGTGVSFVKSTDGGSTFSAPNATFNTNFMAISGNTLYALQSGVSVWNVYKSTDGGVNWTITPNNLSLSSQSYIYATPNGNVYIDNQKKSTDGGTTWTSMTLAPSGSVFFIDKSNNYFVRNEPTNLYKSNDAGVTYTDVVNGLDLSPSTSMQYIITTNDGKLYVSTTGAGSYSLYIHGTAPTSIKESNNLENEINVFPNPASQFVNVDVKNYNVEEVSVLDVNCKLVNTSISFFNTNAKIDVSTLPNGVYFVKVKSINNKPVYKKIIINN